ncbi:MAG: (Fe-S)-binding protein [Anaerolineales bacterium]|nr:(Fe-S)-binding protein [Anaerolineales bacterium]
MASSQNKGNRRIDELKNIVYQCNRCGQCLDFSTLGQAHKCPAYVGGLFESYASRGKYNIARALVDGVIDYDMDIANRVFACTECRACAQDCFKYLDTTSMFTALKEDLASLGLIPPKLKAGLEGEMGLDKVHNVYQAPHEERLSWLADKSHVDVPAETAIYIGCSSAYVRQNMAVDTVATMERLGVDYTILSDEWCCGHPYMAAGEIEKARQSLENSISQYVKLGVKRIVFNCPGCLKTFKHDAPEILGRPLPFEPMHILELIAYLAEEKKIHFKPVNPKITVTYHDSCTMGRWLGIYEAPRTLLKHIYGVAITEMPRNRANGYCCGAGGLIRYDFSEISNTAGVERFQEAEATGADVLMTSCPACLVQFQQTRSKLRSRMKIMDITQIIWEQILLPGES